MKKETKQLIEEVLLPQFGFQYQEHPREAVGGFIETLEQLLDLEK